MQRFIQILKYELFSLWRQPNDLFLPCLFFVLVVSLFPLALQLDNQSLVLFAPGLIWVAALLAVLLGLNRLFVTDLETGSLDQLLISTYPLPVLVIIKIFAHWLMVGLPLLIVAPLLGVMLQLDFFTILILLLSLFVGTLILNFIGSLGCALTLGAHYSGALLALLILPLSLPVLIFGVGMVNAFQNQRSMVFPGCMLFAFLMIAISFFPWLTAVILRLIRQ